ncbi:hypothetical protein D9M71_833920 [compost metagenome]
MRDYLAEMLNILWIRLSKADAVENIRMRLVDDMRAGVFLGGQPHQIVICRG